MNRNEWWMATCVAALVVGVGVGQAQEKPAKPRPIPAPQVFYVPPIPLAHPLALQLAGLEAIGCKVCVPAVQAAEAKCKSCTGCAECGQAKTGECCSECAQSKTGQFACDGAGQCVPVKKVKKSKKSAPHDYFQIAVPPLMPPQCVPITIYAPAPAVPCPNNMLMPIPAPTEPMMVFRSASHAKASACGSCGCDSGVQQAKHETHGKFSIALGLGLTHGVPVVQLTTSGQLEIECGAGCKMKCEHMTLSMPDGKELTVATIGKQVVVSGPSLKAMCDSLTRCGSESSICLTLQGHVRLHQGKDGMKTDVEAEQVRLFMHDGRMEVHTVMSH